MKSSLFSGWGQALSMFADRRAIIMFFLGFSAGIPILLIFSSLSLWLGEAGIERQAVTFFSWAALGYSFKFVWAPLIDELPLPFLTRVLGRRRAWLLVAQLLIILSISIMAFSDPAMGQAYLIQMAVGAVLLGFSAATQDIVIDAYRIELAGIEMQTILASTYNAGYRIGMIIAGAGALFLAAKLGTAKGNYIYAAWKYTYLAMAAVMFVGVATTLIIYEPIVDRIRKQYKRTDYFRLVLVFFIAVTSFVLSYIFFGEVIEFIVKKLATKDSFILFSFEALRFIGSGAIAFSLGALLVKVGAVNKQMAYETWVNPVADFFRRYGLKLALVLLLLIGFYRISDIIAGVISNVFYQDLNFTKEQIAEAVKIYGVIFSLLGGFLGGLLAQRFNIMKLMFVGAILASSTNLIFVGLVKSGQQLNDVSVTVGQQQYQVQSDEVGYWKLKVPSQVLAQANDLQVSVQYNNDAKLLNNQHTTVVNMPYLKHETLSNGGLNENLEQANVGQDSKAIMHILPLTSDNVITQFEKDKNLVVRGQYFGAKLNPTEKLILTLDGKNFDAKLDDAGIFSAAIPAEKLINSPSKQLVGSVAFIDGNMPTTSNATATTTTHTYKTNMTSAAKELDVDIQPLAMVNTESSDEVELSGKVIKPYSSLWLYAAIIVDNLASGLAGAAFIAFLSSLTSVSFTAVQYAIFSSLMTLVPKILGGYSGTIVTSIGYPNFFIMTTLIGIPVLILVWWVAKLLGEHQKVSDY